MYKFRKVLLVAFTLLLSPFAQAEDHKVDNKPVDVIIAGYSSGGQVSIFGEAVVNSVRQIYPGSKIVYEPGNPAGALENLRRGQRPFALVSTIEPTIAMAGLPPFIKPAI